MKNAEGNTVTKFTYGDEIVPTLYTVAAGTSDTTEVTDPVTYKYKTSQKAHCRHSLTDRNSMQESTPCTHTQRPKLTQSLSRVYCGEESVDRFAKAKDNVSDINCNSSRAGDKCCRRDSGRPRCCIQGI